MTIQYWLDSDVLIESKKRWYSFEIAPSFWSFLDSKSAEGIIAASSLVYSELVNHSDDELAAWARERRGPPFFVEPDNLVQRTFTTIADFVRVTYEPRKAEDFLSGADPWEIAQAVTYGGLLVTNETRVDPASRKVKIPNVCDHFDVKCENLFDMLKALGLRL